jgi:hypothetical protein
MQALLESEFRAAEHAMEERLGRTTIEHLVQETLTRERELARQH